MGELKAQSSKQKAGRLGGWEDIRLKVEGSRRSADYAGKKIHPQITQITKVKNIYPQITQINEPISL